MRKKSSHFINICLIFFFIVIYSSLSYAQVTYWQQKVDYKIQVTLDDSLHTLKGFEEIMYTNNSPNVLNDIIIHLYPNAYSSVNTDFATQKIEDGSLEFLNSSKNERGYIDSLQFKINDENIGFKFKDNKRDIIIIPLIKPLESGKSVKITTPFFVKIPKTFSRIGHEEQAYAITQWYPSVAVYDKNGWQYMPYLDQGEFYADFGCFDVSITLPKNYVVASTGILQNESEKKFIEEKINATKRFYIDQKEAIKNELANKKDNLSYEEFPASSNEMKTIRYTQCDIHDFAWFADKRYLVDKSKVQLPNTKKMVDTYCFYAPDRISIYKWKESARFIDSTLYYFSSWIGDYKYDECSAVYGALSAGGGMEYPMVTIISPGVPLEEVIVHEVGHNWFQGMFGTNERKHPWMDEGVNSFYEKRLIHNHAQTKSKSLKVNGISLGSFMNKQKDGLAENVLINTIIQRTNLHQALNLSSEVYKPINYGAMLYMQTPVQLNYLEDYLGKPLFDKAMQDFFQTWSLKHPDPQDMKKSYEKTTNKNLDWFFNDLISTKNTLNYAISKVKSENNTYKISIKNKGKVNAPYKISALKDNKIVASQWYDPCVKSDTVDFPIGEYDELVIDADYKSLDINRHNNFYRFKAPYHQWKGFKFNFITGKEVEGKTSINFLPALGFNENDKFMLGAVFHNTTLPYSGKLQYELVPMYGFGSKKLSGLAHVRYNFYPNSVFRNIYVDVKAQKFSLKEFKDIQPDYLSIHPKLAFEIKNKTDRNRSIHTVAYTPHLIFEKQIVSKGIDTILMEPILGLGENQYLIHDISYSVVNTKKLNPYQFSAHFEKGPGFSKIYSEAKIKILYPKNEKKGFEIRGFGGYFLQYDIFSSDLISNSKFTLGGTQSGYDYKYENLFLGRNYYQQGKDKQIFINDGGFKSHIDLDYFTASKSMFAVNVKADLPFSLPIGFFADAGILNNVSEVKFEYADKIQYDAGIYFSMFSNSIELYLPLLWNDELKLNLQSLQPKWYDRISFSVQLKNLNPINYVRDVRKLNF